MRKIFLPALALAALAVQGGGLARAADRGTPDEAKVLAERAAARLKEVGPERALADFESAAGGYVDRDLFVVTYSPDGKVASSFGVPALRGRDATQLKDVEGRMFGREILDLAHAKGTGWVEYRMLNPATHKIELKESYVVAVDNYVVFVGAYR